MLAMGLIQDLTYRVDGQPPLKSMWMGGRISKIDVLDNVRFVQEGVSDTLFEKVISTQDTKVDTVSGATVTSKAYLKAIENALVQ
ncbi:MAG: FMN-binding protein [Dethiosulfatibacter sp.]|nr:FMN-binding protein [Dethiosulfatibacter sp.]